MALDGLSDALGLGPNASAVIARVAAIYRSVDERVGQGAAKTELPCKAGCDACCHESVFVCAPEFLTVVAELHERWDETSRRRLVDEMRELALDFEDELLLLETIEEGAERDEVAFRVRFRCPMLSTDGRCRVYAARELNGRTFGQTWNSKRDAPYGCDLTLEAAENPRLPVLQEVLFDAVEARRMLAAEFPELDFVHVYPWWFTRYAAWIV